MRQLRRKKILNAIVCETKRRDVNVAFRSQRLLHLSLNMADKKTDMQDSEAARHDNTSEIRRDLLVPRTILVSTALVLPHGGSPQE